MASMRDALRRLDVIYVACAPEAIEAAAADKNLDDFTRLKKKVNKDAKDVRKALKEREVLIKRSGTSSETAEASYHIRVMTRQLKEDVTKMNEIMIREEKKRGKKRLADEELGVRREIISLCNQHIQECEELEKRRFADKEGIDRAELLQEPAQAAGISVDGKRRPYGAQEKPESNEVRRALFEGASNKKAAVNKDEPDPFQSNLPEIDVEEDFKQMNERNQIIDKELEDISVGVSKLKEIANDMNKELDDQNDALRDLEKGVDKVLDDVDNVNIKLKRIVDTMMTGDRFMVNCVLLCVILALVAFIASVFTG